MENMNNDILGTDKYTQAAIAREPGQLKTGIDAKWKMVREDCPSSAGAIFA